MAQRKTPLSDLELQIGLHVGLIRRLNKITQDDLAKKIGITRSQLANIESGRVAMRLGTGWKLSEVMDINPMWFVNPNSGGPFPDLSNNNLRLATEKYIEAHKNEEFGTAWVSIDYAFHPDSTGNIGLIRRKIMHSSGAAKGKTPDVKLESDLTTYANNGNNLPMQPIMPKLIERLKKATAERGSKSKLATWLGVPPQSVTDWMAGRKEPSGETTLRLLAWVTAEEGKPKSPTGEETPAEQKTRSRKSTHEKPESGPPEQ